MENSGVSASIANKDVQRKPRSTILRRPRYNVHLFSGSNENLRLSSAQSSRKLSPDDHGESDSSFQRKEMHINKLSSRSASVDMGPSIKIRKDNKACKELNECSQCHWMSTSEVRGGLEMEASICDLNAGNCVHGLSTAQSDRATNVNVDNKLMKVKLIVGGVTRTIHTKTDSSAGNDAFNSKRSSSTLHPFPNVVKLSKKGNSDGHFTSERKRTLYRDCNNPRFSLGVNIDSKEEGSPRTSYMEPTRKSRRVPKKRVFDDGQEDEGRCYLEKPKTSKLSVNRSEEYDENDEVAVKRRRISNISRSPKTAYEVDEDYASRSRKEKRRRSKPGKASGDGDYYDTEETGSDGPAEIKRNKRFKLDFSSDLSAEPLTTRQRALQSGKDGNGESLIEFPNGLPSNPSSRAKSKLSEEEKQAKKAEAAQRRRLQVEKQARESEASAIRKILGHDSNKKKEEKRKKELEKAKAAESKVLKPSTIRWVLGPNGTQVTFADDIGLPSIFSSKPCSYPPPREKCAGPSCANPYIYRDSKSKLPLCSLECYRAVRANAELFSTC